MRKARRVVGSALAVAAFWAVSCRDIPAPDNGVQSISGLILGSPGLVAGDTLRDSLGFAAPLNVIGYGTDNEPVDPQPTPVFVMLDTGAFLADGRYLVGETPGTRVRIVGQVGGLQTLPDTVVVTLSPEALVATDSITHLITFAAADTIASAVLNTRVVHFAATDTSGVEAVVVRYAIVDAPPGSGTAPTAVLLNNAVPSDRDTTDNTGRASRTARLRRLASVDFAEDTIIVNSTASYRGSSIGTIQFVLVFRKTVPPPAAGTSSNQ